MDIMSLVIAVKEKDRVVMMADSAETSGEYLSRIYDEGRYKIQVIGEVLVGSVGKVSNVRKLLTHPEWFDTKGKEFDKSFIVNNIVPRFYEELKNSRMLEINENELPKSKATFIIAVKDRIYKMFNDFSVMEYDRSTSAGCTTGIVYPYIKDIEHGQEKEKMLDAMHISAKLDSAVGAPYIYIDTVDRKYEILEG